MKLTRILSTALAILVVATITSCTKDNDKRAAAREYMKNQTTHYTANHAAAAETNESAESGEKNVVVITDKNFDKTIAKGVTFVDFWAEWCRPCRMQGPIVSEIAGELKGKITVGKLDIDMNKKVPQRFQVQNIPTMLIFKDGVVVERIVGLTDKATLMNYINKHI